MSIFSTPALELAVATSNGAIETDGRGTPGAIVESPEWGLGWEGAGPSATFACVGSCEPGLGGPGGLGASVLATGTDWTSFVNTTVAMNSIRY